MAELLAQDVVALLGRQRLLRLFADLLGQLQDLDAPGNERQHLVETLLDVDRLQHILFFGGRTVADAGNEIGERGSGIERVDRRRHLGGNAGQELDHRPGALAQQVDAGLDLRGQGLRDADLLDPRGQKGKAGDIFDDAEAAHALADRMMGAVGRGDVANDSA